MKLVAKEMTVKHEEEAITYTMMAEPKVKVTSQYALSKFSGIDLQLSSMRKSTTQFWLIAASFLVLLFFFRISVNQRTHE